MKPQVVQRSMVDLPSSREKRFDEPYRREKSDISVRSSVPDTRARSREVPRARGRVDLNKLVNGSIGDILRNRRFFTTLEIRIDKPILERIWSQLANLGQTSNQCWITPLLWKMRLFLLTY